MYDVIIIGGNLAGSSAAIRLAEKNANVILIEKNKEPFNPAHCGEMLFDIESDSLNFDKIGCTKNYIKNMIIDINRKSYNFNFKRNGIIIFDRNFIENKLLEKVKNEGIELILGMRMKDFLPPNKIILENNKKINGKIIIDATGISCHVGKQVGIVKKIKSSDVGVCIQSRVKSNFEVDTVKSWFHRPYAPFGYAWLFPLNDKIANIGLGIPGGQKVDMSKLLADYIKNVTNNNFEILSTFRSCVPLAKPIDRLVRDNVMITGDAARLAHSLSGGGINNAIFSGNLAGIVSAKYLNNELESLETYQELMQRKISTLTKEYRLRCNLIKNDDSYLTKFRMGVSAVHFINKFFPRFFEKVYLKLTENDKRILKSLGETNRLL